MNITRKIEEICAMRLEAGKGIASAWAYNGNTIQSLGTLDSAIPYISKSVKISQLLKDDESVTGAAFKDLPSQVGKEAPMDSFSGIVKYMDMNKMWYWMLGYEDGGSSPDDLGAGVKAHLYEMDRHERHFTTYRTDEQTAGDYSANDRKNRFATFAFKRGPNDHRFHHQLCTGFSFSSNADDGLVMFTAKAIGPNGERGDYDSANWTFPTYLDTANYNVLHRHCTLSISSDGGETYTDLGVTSWDVNAEIPVDVKRDTESGLYPIEPVMGGFNTVSGSFVVSRHSVDTYLGLRDNLTECILKIVASSGSYEFGLYMPSIVINDASISEDDVPNHPISWVAGQPLVDNTFSSEFGDIDVIQNGPLAILTKNTNSTNEMRRE